MRQPGILIRIIGTPLITCLLIATSALVIYGWYFGDLDWWLALAAVGVVFRTLSAVGSVRRYKTWGAEWEAMASVTGAPPPAAKPKPWKRALLMTAALIAIPMASALPAIHGNPSMLRALQWAWGIFILYCLYRVLSRLWGHIRQRRERGRESRLATSLDDPITVAVGHHSDCPTRSSAQRNLPDYCLKLIGRE